MKVILPLLLIAALAAAGLYFTGTDNRQASTDSDMMQLGNFAYQDKRFDDAFKWYMNAAQQGISQAQFRVSQMYQAGEGTNKDEILATQWLLKAANQELAQAEYEYALALEFGRGVERANLTQVAPWYQKAAKHGQKEATLKLAELFLSGTGIKQDMNQALKWSLVAKNKSVHKAEEMVQKVTTYIESKAKSGDLNAQHTLALMYQTGRGVKQSEKSFLSWLKKAAQKGNDEAQYDLGKHFAKTGDWSKATYWLNKSAQQGHAQAGYLSAALLAQSKVGSTNTSQQAWRWLYHGKQMNDSKVLYNLATILNQSLLGLPRNNTNYQHWLEQASQGGIIEAQTDYASSLLLNNQNTKSALFWLKQAANSDAKAQFNLGFVYARGQRITPNDDAAIHWFRKAAQNNDARAKMILGLFYNLGRGVGRSEEEAVSWYMQAAEQGQESAIYNLGVLYYNGRGIDQNYKKAAQYFAQLAKKDDTAAQNIYGSLFLEGQGVEYSPKTAVKWFAKSAKLGDIKAMFNLATQYRTGNGVAQDDEKAMLWYRKAADLNFAPAQNAMGYMYAQGRGTKADKDLAEVWFQKASDNGLRLAVNNANALKNRGSFSLLRLQIDNHVRDDMLTSKNIDLSQWLEVHQEAIL